MGETFTDPQIRVDMVTANDLEDVALIDRLRWGDVSGVDVITVAQVQKWHQEGSPFYLIARTWSRTSHAYVPTGYYFGIMSPFAFSRAWAEDFCATNGLKTNGYAELPHTPKANALYGINITSLHPKTALALQGKVVELLARHKLEFMFGMARLSGLRVFINQNEFLGNNLPKLEEIANHYTFHQQQSQNGFFLHEHTPKPHPALLKPRHKDPVLHHHVRGLRKHTFLATLPYMETDVNSAGFGALLTAIL